MYQEYFNSPYGVIEVKADDFYLRSVKIIEKENNNNSNEITKKTISQLKEYFNHERKEFDVPLEFKNTFNDQVLKALYEVNYGKTLSYKGLGEKVGTKAYRAVGSVMAKNKIPFIIPCHRVLKNDGSVGQFYYGPKMKEQLLLQEKRFIFQENNLFESNFSNEEIEKIKNHEVLNKMFKVMPIVTKTMQFNDIFSCLVSQIIYQQVAFKTAFKQETLLYHHFNYKLTKESFKDDKILISLGLNGPRLKYIQNIANHDFDYNLLYKMNDDEIYKELIKIKGIGSWTIEMALLFGLNRKDIISYKDLIIINGIKHLYQLEQLSINKFNEIIQEFKGFETIVSMNLWNYIEGGYYLKTGLNE